MKLQIVLVGRIDYSIECPTSYYVLLEASKKDFAERKEGRRNEGTIGLLHVLILPARMCDALCDTEFIVENTLASKELLN
jgi:hypothetical protein